MRIPYLMPLALAVGCAATGGRVANPTTVIQMEPVTVEVDRATGKVLTVDAVGLFEQAGADLEAQRFDEAVKGYDRLVHDFADSRYVPAALYNAGLALEGKKDWLGAAARYRRIVAEHGKTKDALDGLFRMGGCYAEAENWASSADAFAQLLEHTELSTSDRVEAMTRRGLAQYKLEGGRAAERSFRDALALWRANQQVERLDNDFFIAMSQFYLGEIAHDQFRAMPLRLPQKQLERDLDAKAQSLLATQARYVDTARIRNAAWATAAGFQMAMLYREFYDSLMAAPVPPELKGEAVQVYNEELRKQIEPLLRKAIHAHELTQGVAERNHVDNEWVRKSNAQLEQLRALLGPSGEGGRPIIEAPTGAPPTPKPVRPETEKRVPAPQPPGPGDEYHPRVVM